MSTIARIGFVGLGVMGEPICRNLAEKCGVSVSAFDPQTGPLAHLQYHGMKSMVPGVFPLQAFSTEYAYKDITYALQLAEDTRIVARGAKPTRSVLQQTIDAGHGKEYWPVPVRTVERA